MTVPRFGQFRFFRTLRFRLASTFLLLVTVILAIVGWAGTKTLQNLLESQSEEQLKEQIGAIKGYLQFVNGKYLWSIDHSDPEEENAVAWLRTVYVIANHEGTVIESAPEELDSHFNKPTILADLSEIRTTHLPVLHTVTGDDGTPYQILASIMTDPGTGQKWYIAEGRSLERDRKLLHRFRTSFAVFLPIALFVCAAVTWYSAGAGLRSLHAVEAAAQEITGSNLGLQIPKRGADDELDRLIDSFNAMSGRLKASFEQIRQFSTDVSHELRTPLTAIQGQLEVALFTATRKEQLQEAIENALQDVERLSNLVRALLLLSQSETGQIPMHKGSLDLAALLSDLVDQFQIPAEAERVSLVVVDKGPVFCEADRTQLERVITNLLSNAIKYTSPGGWIRTRAENSGQSVRLVVEDSGVGIPRDHLPHIFDRFYRVPDPNPEKGLGLGLSFVAAIVKAHGGQINVESQPGKGSRFEVVLPAAHAAVKSESEVML